MGWPKGKPRGKKKVIKKNLYQQQLYNSESDNFIIKDEDFLKRLKENAEMNKKISEVRGMIGLPETKIWIDPYKVYFVSLINEKIISFKLAE